MTTVTTSKPFHIDKKRVYEAYKAVRSNRGAAGVDGQRLEQFDEDLGGNLYKIWNRMSSGSYFPPPVRAVSISKKNGGGERILGVPTVGDRIAQMVVKQLIEADLDSIPRSVQKPKFAGRDDTEVIRYLITIDTPFSGHLLAQKGQDCGFEVSECRMTSIVGDMLVHQPP
jgi:hypothetical protein